MIGYVYDHKTGLTRSEVIPDISYDDETRTVTTTGTDGHTTTRPYTAAENDAADRALAENARLDDLMARVAYIEAHLWPAPPDPTVNDAPTVEAFDTVWPAGGLIRDGGTIWRNVAGVPLTTPPSGFPGSPPRWVHLFVDVTPKATPPAIPAWSASATYTVGDTVTRDGRIWRCLVAHGPERQGTWGPSPAAPTIWTDIGPA